MPEMPDLSDQEIAELERQANEAKERWEIWKPEKQGEVLMGRKAGIRETAGYTKDGKRIENRLVGIKTSGKTYGIWRTNHSAIEKLFDDKRVPSGSSVRVEFLKWRTSKNGRPYRDYRTTVGV